MALVFPFNFNPAATVQADGDAISYTVPAGHYAFMSVNIFSSACQTWAVTNISGADMSASTADPKVANNTYWLSEGDVVTSSVPALIDVATNTGSGIVVDTSIGVSVSINGNIAAQVISQVKSTTPTIGASTLLRHETTQGGASISVAEYAIP
jgi:hypothetical protein